MNKSTQLNDLKNKWKMFIRHEWANDESGNADILLSWKKCLKKTDPYKWQTPVKASGHTWNVLLQKNQELVRVARRVIEDHYQVNPNNNIALFVVDENGWTLSTHGEGEVFASLSALGFEQGMSWREDQTGTTACSLCASTHQFSILTGAEHFNAALHPFTTSASPVIDHYGQLHGFVVCVGEAESEVFSPTIAYACAVEIANILYIEQELHSTNRVMCQHNAIIECMDDGFICWDSQMNITMINSQAAGLLKINHNSLIGKNVKETFVFPPVLSQSIAERTKLPQRQVVLECRGEFIELMITLRPLSDGSFLLFLHPLDKIRKMAQQQMNNNASFTFDRLSAASKKMKQVLTVARRMLKATSPLLIYGEEGVGKLSLAMAIHNESDSSSGPFITLDCQMLSTENMVQELLGSDEGPVPSRFELAQNGTLYLEKIEYLSAELQSALLKVLKTGLVVRADSHRLIPVKFRLIACTSSLLRDYVQRGAFSRQLFYEVSMNEIEIPPLRKRKEDLALMIGDTLSRYQERMGKKLVLTPQARMVLESYPWPGNISEFKNRMEKILLGCQQTEIQPDDIPLEMRQPTSMDEGVVHLASLEEVEIQAIENACRACDWNLSKVAGILKIGRTTLWRKIKAYNLEPKSGVVE